jgi:hypothetical protein
VDSRLRRSPPDRASAIPMDKPGKTQCVSPALPTGRRLPNKLHSTPQQHGMILFRVSGNDQTNSRLPAFSLFLPEAVQTTGTVALPTGSAFRASRARSESGETLTFAHIPKTLPSSKKLVPMMRKIEA